MQSAINRLWSSRWTIIAAAAVIFAPGARLPGVDDCKKLDPRERERLAPEQHEHHHGGDAEPHGEEVGRRHVLDEVVDEEERRPPHGRDADEQERGEPGVPGRGGHGRVRRSSR
jgi:hypothetical protein